MKNEKIKHLDMIESKITPQYIFEHEIIPEYLSKKLKFLNHAEKGSGELQKEFLELWEKFIKPLFNKGFKSIKLEPNDFLAEMVVMNKFNFTLIMKMPSPQEIRDCFYIAFNIDHNYAIRYFTLEKGNNCKIIAEWDLVEDCHSIYEYKSEISKTQFINKIKYLVTKELKPFEGYKEIINFEEHLY